MINVYINKKNFRKGFQSETILSDIEFEIPDEKMVLLLAPSGVGKSTLMNCILQQTNFKGSICFDTESNVSFVSQQSTVDLRETVLETVFYATALSYPHASKNAIQSHAEQYINMLDNM
ncbi:MAG: ATP-binding cassette domain-containing protein [Lachnospiraceae bacterium]